MSTQRPLHILSYDITEPGRLKRVHTAVKAWSTGGQKSVHECYLTATERSGLLAEVKALIDPSEDSVVLVRLDPRMGIHTLGIAVRPRDEPFFYVG